MTPEVASVLAAQRAAAPWPYREVDVATLRRQGWRPTPIREVVLKVHQRCNLACDYCYVYEHADQSWRDRPRSMTTRVRQAAVSRLAEHARRHGLDRVRVLHGGEPMLYGLPGLLEIAAEVRAALPADCVAEIGLQTNGVLLTDEAVASLRDHRIRVGVSVDGVAAVHDRHRRTPSGQGTFAAVRRALDRLARPENRSAYAGVLCTIAPDSDPIACYDQLLAFDPPMIDFLFPHANWSFPPPRSAPDASPYADWLIPVFDRWYAASAPTRVRLFEDVLSLLLGGPSGSEQVGLSPSGVIVVESDGAIEQIDALKTAYPGACATGRGVLTDDFDSVLLDPGIVARQIGSRALADECLACPIRQACGGGHYAHRYAAGSGFRHSSVYCPDLSRFINHVGDRVRADVRRLALTGAA